jgi:hypothetical protein
MRTGKDKPMTYQAMLDLGFQREEEEDEVWFQLHGYSHFRLLKKYEYTTGYHIYFDWSVEDHSVTASVACDEEGRLGDSKYSWHGNSLEYITEIIRFMDAMNENNCA